MIVTQAVCSWQEASAITMEQNCKVHGVLIPHWSYPSANPCKHIYKMLLKVCLSKSLMQVIASAVMQKLQFTAQNNCSKEVPLQQLDIFSIPNIPC